jgi:hypothetical protein
MNRFMTIFFFFPSISHCIAYLAFTIYVARSMYVWRQDTFYFYTLFSQSGIDNAIVLFNSTRQYPQKNCISSSISSIYSSRYWHNKATLKSIRQQPP